MRSRPEPQPSAASAVVLTVDDWAGTFQVPSGAERRFEPGPRWWVPTGGALGLILAVVLIRPGPPSPLAAIGLLLFVACVATISLDWGGSRGVTAAIAAATVFWVATGAVLFGGAVPDDRVVIGFLTVGVLGQVVGAERLRRRAHEDRDCVIAAHRGTRNDGWVVRVDGPPWARRLSVEASTGTDGSWTGAWTGSQPVRPPGGYPVGIWHGEAGRAVVLVPRAPR